MSRYLSFFLVFSFFSLLLLGTSLGLAHLLFGEESLPVGAFSGGEVTIILDAGHGGRDGGALAEDGTREKDLNLAVAKKLGALLETANIRVVMTREEDTELAPEDSTHKKRDDLMARLEMTKAHENAILVSIHMNKFPVEKYSGLQVYYSKNNEKSMVLAETIQEGARFLREENNRKTKAAGDNIYLLYHTEIPAVLVECGFLSNEAELAFLKSDGYQWGLAVSLYTSILEFIAENSI